MTGKSVQSYLAAGVFLLASLGFVGVSIWRARSGKTAQVTSNRREYLSYLSGIRGLARRAGSEQRKHLTWIHPEPVALAAVAEEGTRVWERAPERRGLAPRPVCARPAAPRAGAQAAGVRHHRQARPGVSLGAAPAARDAPDPSGPADRRRAELVRPHRDHRFRGHARAQARALLVQAATFHAPDQLVIAVLTEPPRSPTGTGSSGSPTRRAAARPTRGTARLVCTDLDELVSLLPADLSERAPVRAGAAPRSRRTSSSSSTTRRPGRPLGHHRATASSG